MWLLDANVDVHLVPILRSFGVECDTAANRGWKSLSNGDLVRAAVEARFQCLLTRDRLFGESAARALKSFPDFAVVVVEMPQLIWPEYSKQFRQNWLLNPIVPVPGKLTSWPLRSL